MTRRKRILSVAAFLLGLVGAIACVGGIVGIWCVKARVRHVAENVFKKIDTSIGVVREHFSQTQDRITTLKTTTVALRQFVKNWSKKGAPGSDALWIEVTRRAERLESSVQIADKLLEISESSITWVHEALSMAGAAGSSQESTNVGELIEVLASLRSHLATARKLVLGIEEHSTTANNETPTEERIEQCVQLAQQVISTLGKLESLFKRFENRLSKTQSNLSKLEARTQRWTLIATIGITLLLAWMAIGQGAMCLLARKGLSGRRGQLPMN